MIGDTSSEYSGAKEIFSTIAGKDWEQLLKEIPKQKVWANHTGKKSIVVYFLLL